MKRSFIPAISVRPVAFRSRLTAVLALSDNQNVFFRPDPEMMFVGVEVVRHVVSLYLPMSFSCAAEMAPVEAI
jgi:hypothetical protein